MSLVRDYLFEMEWTGSIRTQCSKTTIIFAILFDGTEITHFIKAIFYIKHIRMEKAGVLLGLFDKPPLSLKWDLSVNGGRR